MEWNVRWVRKSTKITERNVCNDEGQTDEEERLISIIREASCNSSSSPSCCKLRQRV